MRENRCECDEEIIGYLPFITACKEGHPSIVAKLAAAGADLSLLSSDIYATGTIFFSFITSADVRAELKKHGMTRSNIPKTFQQSKHYFDDGKGEIYLRNVIRQRWLNLRPLIMSMARLYSWSQLHQVETDALRTLPPNLSDLGRLIARCFMHVDGGSFDNGIARLITEYYGGYDASKSPHALIGMPEFGKVSDTKERCSHCIQQCKSGVRFLKCCGRVGYCSKACQKADFKSRHKETCLRMKKEEDNDDEGEAK